MNRDGNYCKLQEVRFLLLRILPVYIYIYIYITTSDILLAILPKLYKDTKHRLSQYSGFAYGR